MLKTGIFVFRRELCLDGLIDAVVHLVGNELWDECCFVRRMQLCFGDAVVFRFHVVVCSIPFVSLGGIDALFDAFDFHARFGSMLCSMLLFPARELMPCSMILFPRQAGCLVQLSLSTTCLACCSMFLLLPRRPLCVFCFQDGANALFDDFVCTSGVVFCLMIHLHLTA